MTGESLGVGDQDLVRFVTKGGSEGLDLRSGASPARWRVCFVAHKETLLSQLSSAESRAFDTLVDQVFYP